MLKSFTLFVFIFLTFSVSFGNLGGELTSKVIIDSICDHGIEIANTNPDSSLSLFQEALKISEENNSSYGKAKSLFLESCILIDYSKYDEARECLDIAYPLSIHINDSLRIASCLNSYALIYLYQNQYDSAHFYFTKMKMISSEMGHEFIENSAMLNLSAIYNETGMFAESVETIFRAIEYFESNEVIFESAICYQNLGSAYLGLGDTLNALKYFNNALPLYREIDNSYQYSEVLQNIGVVYREKGEYKKAGEYITKAIEISDSSDYLRGKATALAQLGILKAETEDINGAFAILDSAIFYSEKINLPDTRDFVLYHLGKIYFNQKKYNKALTYLNKAFKNAESYNNRELLMDIWDVKSKIFSATGNYKKAMQAITEHLQLEEDIRSSKNIRKAALTEKNYEYKLEEAKVKANAKMEKERVLSRLKLERTYKIFAIVILVLVSVMLLGLFYEYTKKRRAYKKLVKKNLALTKAYVRLEELNDKFVEREKRVDNQRLNEILTGLDKMIREEKIFLDRELTQQKLANILGTNSSYLSEIINTSFQKNFSTYMNEKRIEYTLQQLAEGNFKKYSVEGIALASGFSSRSTFHRAFKKITGVSPACYVENAEPILEEVGFMN
ncbi:MAG: tetratricopeptide repeat protein [Prolixibacteraceae bacterium]|nr:tetratricopeptide repeat protein [Prolixibacteraceae bacterium]